MLESERVPVTDASEGAQPQCARRSPDRPYRVYSSASQSRVSMTLARSRKNEAAYAPSTARWSNDRRAARSSGWRSPRCRLADDDHRPALHAVGRKDRDLWLVDYRSGEERAERSGVRERERATADVVGKSLQNGPESRGRGSSGHPPERDLRLRARQARSDPDGRDRRRSQVDLMVDDQRIVTDRGVEVRLLVQSLDHRAGDERQVGEREAFFRLELVLRNASCAPRSRSPPRARRGCAAKSPSTSPCALRSDAACW